MFFFRQLVGLILKRCTVFASLIFIVIYLSPIKGTKANTYHLSTPINPNALNILQRSGLLRSQGGKRTLKVFLKSVIPYSGDSAF